MKKVKVSLLGTVVAVSLSACATQPLSHAADDPRFDALTSEKLTPFASVSDYEKWLLQSESLEAKRRKAKRREVDRQRTERQKTGGKISSDVVEDIIVTGTKRQASGPNITNVQNRGVDEGDIVKQVGDHLVLMQDGRLFSLDIATTTPRLSARIDIYDHVDEDIWYDELLVSGRKLVVTGYHYGKRATEITVFDLDAQGQFSRRGRWYLGSKDYYSRDNSATRMIGNTLIFHTQGSIDDPEDWPVLRSENQTQIQPILKAQSIYPPLFRLANPDLHIVTSCTVSDTLQCQSRAVMASNRADWIVTEKAGYLWTAKPRANWWLNRNIGTPKRNHPNTLYRFPIGADDKIEAVTLDADLASRFAFEVKGERILALVSQAGDKQALLDMPLSDMSERPERVSATNFTPLPGDYPREMRFTEDNLIYASNDEDNDVVYIVDLKTHLPFGPLAVPHSVGRLDRVGQNAVLIGEDADDINLSWLDLTAAPRLTDTLTLENRLEAEGRAQALNMRVEENGAALLGLPTLTYDKTGDWDEEDGTDISFTRVSNFGQLTDLGAAKGDPDRVDPDYKCETSCVDWYGNARPFFIGDRIFALIASELIELQDTRGGLIEGSRVNLSAEP